MSSSIGGAAMRDPPPSMAHPGRAAVPSGGVAPVYGFPDSRRHPRVCWMKEEVDLVGMGVNLPAKAWFGPDQKPSMAAPVGVVPSLEALRGDSRSLYAPGEILDSGFSDRMMVRFLGCHPEGHHLRGCTSAGVISGWLGGWAQVSICF